MFWMVFYFIVISLVFYFKCNRELLKEFRMRSSMVNFVLMLSSIIVRNRLIAVYYGMVGILEVF